MFGSFLIFDFAHSYFDRTYYDNLLRMSFGNYRMKDALTDELLLISYSYSHGTPRFYTKSHALNSAFYLSHDVEMSLAAAATSATPFYFDPVFRPIYNNRKRD